MDIALVGENSLKLKGKQVSFIIDPEEKMPKIQADAVILLNGKNNTDISRVIDSRITIDGPGGYEIGGAKIYGTRTPKGILYKFLIDGMNIIAGKTAELKTDGFDECQVAIVNASGEFSESFVAVMEPKMVVLYGEKKMEAAHALGQENVSAISKITISKDKLPEKMEVVVLG